MTADVANVGTTPLANALVRTTVFARTFSRSQLRSFFDGGPTGPVLGSTSKRVPDVAPGATTRVTIDRAVRSFAPRMARTGVYPVEVRLATASPPVALRTAVPYFASDPNEPVNVALVFPISAPYVTEPDGSYADGSLDRLDLPGLLAKLQALGDRSALPVTLAFDPSTLSTLRDISDGYRITDGQAVAASDPLAQTARNALRAARIAATAADELATVPFAAIDAPTLVERMTPGELVRHVTVGRTETASVLGRTPTTDLLVPRGGRLNAASMNALRAPGIRTIVLDRSVVNGPTEPFQPQLFGPSRPVRIAGPDDVTGFLADPDLADRLDAGGDAVMTAQALLAETAAAWLELPLFGSDRVLTVLAPSLPPPDTITTLLRGFDRSPWARLGQPSTLIDRLPPQGAAVRFREVGLVGASSMREALNARRLFTALQRIAPTLPPTFDRLGELVLVSAADEWNVDLPRGRALAGYVSEQVRAAFDNVRLARRPHVTLTARTGEIPITVVNDNDFPVSVRVKLESIKVTFTKGSTRTRDLLPSRADTMGFPVEVLATGSFPITVRIETPDGKRLIAASELVLRSTAASTVTLFLVGGSILFLLVASVRRGIRRRAAASNASPH